MNKEIIFVQKHDDVIRIKGIMMKGIMMMTQCQWQRLLII